MVLAALSAEGWRECAGIMPSTNGPSTNGPMCFAGQKTDFAQLSAVRDIIPNTGPLKNSANGHLHSQVLSRYVSCKLNPSIVHEFHADATAKCIFGLAVGEIHKARVGMRHEQSRAFRVS